MRKTVFLSLGGNHDNTFDLLQFSIKKIEEFSMMPLLISKFYTTPPWGFEAENDFLNCAVKISVDFSAIELLNKINAIEEELGRVRVGGGYTSRPIDIDIIYFGDEIISTKKLQIPHPRMCERNFVMYPLYDLAPYWIDPIKNNTVSCLLRDCVDDSDIVEY